MCLFRPRDKAEIRLTRRLTPRLSGQVASVGRATVGAKADEGEVPEAGPNVDGALDAAPGAVQVLRVDGDGGAAALAQRVLMVVVAGQLIKAGPMPEVDMADEAEALKMLQVAVRRRHIERRQRGGGDLFCGQGAIRSKQNRENRPARGGDASTVLAQNRLGLGQGSDGACRALRGLRHRVQPSDVR